jgi:hypothetical protein
MNRFRVTIRLAMALMLFAGVALAALRDPSVWWVGGVIACLVGLLLTACVGAMYRTGRERVLAGDRRLRGRLAACLGRYSEAMGVAVIVSDKEFGLSMDSSSPSTQKRRLFSRSALGITGMHESTNICVSITFNRLTAHKKP